MLEWSKHFVECESFVALPWGRGVEFGLMIENTHMYWVLLIEQPVHDLVGHPTNVLGLNYLFSHHP